MPAWPPAGGRRACRRRRASAATARGTAASSWRWCRCRRSRRPGTARPTRAPVVARRWSWCARQRPPCSGRGTIRMPSSSSCASPPSAAQLADERRDAVGLVAADVPDAVERRRAVGERGQREDRGGQLAGRREVEIDALDAARTGGDGERAAAADDLRAHERQDLGEHRARLRGVRGPARHRHRAAGDHRRREERRGVGQVGLDRDVLAADRPGRHDPFARRRALDVHAAVRERLDGHVDVRDARAAARRRGRGAGRRRIAARRAAGPRRTGSRRSRRS